MWLLRLQSFKVQKMKDQKREQNLNNLLHIQYLKHWGDAGATSNHSKSFYLVGLVLETSLETLKYITS